MTFTLFEQCPLCESCEARLIHSSPITGGGAIDIMTCCGELNGQPCGLQYGRTVRGIDTVQNFLSLVYSADYERDYLDPTITTAKRTIATETRVPDVLDALTSSRKGGAWLDVGCSQGALLLAAQAVGFTGYGIEYSAATAAQARTLGVHHVLEGTLEDTPLPVSWPSAFSVVSAVHVFEHILRPKAFLERARELLEPGGILLIEVPNGDFSPEQAKDDWDDPRHVIHYSRRTLLAILEKAGFDVVRQLGSKPRLVEFVSDLARRWAGWILRPARFIYRKFLRPNLTARFPGRAIVICASPRKGLDATSPEG